MLGDPCGQSCVSAAQRIGHWRSALGLRIDPARKLYGLLHQPTYAVRNPSAAIFDAKRLVGQAADRHNGAVAGQAAQPGLYPRAVAEDADFEIVAHAFVLRAANDQRRQQTVDDRGQLVRLAAAAAAGERVSHVA